MYLSGEQYESILKFDHFINSDYTKFIPNVMVGFSEYCNFPLSVYTIFIKDPDGMVESIHGHNIYSEGLEKYRQGMFKSDLFVQRIDHGKQGPSQKPVLVIPDVATYEEFYDTDYGRYLLSINTPYQAVMRCSTASAPVHILSAFKTSEQGEFTQEELAYLSRIGACFSMAVKLYKQYLNQQLFREFLAIETQHSQHGIAILDAGNRIVFQNDSFLPIVSSLLGTTGIFGSFKALLSAFQTQTGVHPQELTKEACTKLKQAHIKIIPRFITNGETVGKYLFLSVENCIDEASPPPPDDNLGTQFGLTAREEEVARLMVLGYDNNQIAEQLCVNLTTVKYHVQNIYSKLGVNRRAAAITKLLS